MKEELTNFPEITIASDCSILIRFGDSISKQVHEKVFKTFHLLSENKLESIRSIHPAYNTILITLKCKDESPKTALSRIKNVLEEKNENLSMNHRLIEIPVCYEGEFAPDISFVAGHNKLNVDDVIRIHSKEKYLVYFLGFSPGFPYLGDLPDKIAAPRLDKPRVSVPEGSVAIGGNQTGVYPISSPGGWRIIGRTALKLFTPEKNEPTLLQMGDHVKFIPITKNEFEKIKSAQCR